MNELTICDGGELLYPATTVDGSDVPPPPTDARVVPVLDWGLTIYRHMLDAMSMGSG